MAVFVWFFVVIQRWRILRASSWAWRSNGRCRSSLSIRYFVSSWFYNNKMHISSLFLTHWTRAYHSFIKLLVLTRQSLGPEELTLHLFCLETIRSPCWCGSCSFIDRAIPPPRFFDNVTDVETFFPLFELFPFVEVGLVLFADFSLSVDELLTGLRLNLFFWLFLHWMALVVVFIILERYLSQNMLAGDGVIPIHFEVLLSNDFDSEISIYKLIVDAINVIVEGCFF